MRATPATSTDAGCHCSACQAACPPGLRHRSFRHDGDFVRSYAGRGVHGAENCWVRRGLCQAPTTDPQPMRLPAARSALTQVTLHDQGRCSPAVAAPARPPHPRSANLLPSRCQRERKSTPRLSAMRLGAIRREGRTGRSRDLGLRCSPPYGRGRSTEIQHHSDLAWKLGTSQHNRHVTASGRGHRVITGRRSEILRSQAGPSLFGDQR